jgi:myo-inositol 2-dehydrogenase/D-chiro-inositol 1-dehydrogenase
MNSTPPSPVVTSPDVGIRRPVRLGLVGSGWIGTFHAESIALRVPVAVLHAVADPQPGSAQRVAEPLGVATTYSDVADLLADDDVDGVVISSPAFTHTDLVVAAAEAGKAIFVEKPMALTLADADRAIAAAQAAGVPLQVGFNRRFDADFASAYRLVRGGGVGTPQLLRSLTRDPGLANPGSVRPWTMFYETLIHDFDTLNWFNEGASPVEVFAMADALVAPEFKHSGLLDTAVVTIRYDNGAMAVAEASFSASYGYDVRGEIFGSGGMVAVGDVRTDSVRHFGPAGEQSLTTRLNIDLFRQAYTDELVAFADAIRTGQPTTGARGEDARRALSVALACIESVTQGSPVRLGPDGSIL